MWSVTLITRSGGPKEVELLYAIEVKSLAAWKDHCNYKIFYVIPMVTTKKKPIENTQKKEYDIGQSCGVAY